MRMRSIVLAWLLELVIALRYRLDTFLLACETVDRYLASAVVQREKLQLCGAVAVMLAAKYEETEVVETHEYVYFCAENYSVAEFVRQERVMLQTLAFTLHPHFSIPSADCIVPTVLYLVLSCNREKMEAGVSEIRDALVNRETEYGKKIRKLLEDDVLNLKRITKKITWSTKK